MLPNLSHGYGIKFVMITSIILLISEFLFLEMIVIMRIRMLVNMAPDLQNSSSQRITLVQIQFLSVSTWLGCKILFITLPLLMYSQKGSNSS